MQMYILIRRDLTSSQQAVQGGHALAEFLMNCSQNWNNGTLIYLGVNNEFHLQKWGDKLSQLNVDFIEWREPDMSNEITALATYSDRKIFKSLNLL